MVGSLAPPYSPAFARWLVRHMASSGMRRGRDMHRGTRNTVLLQVRALLLLRLPMRAGAPSTAQNLLSGH